MKKLNIRYKLLLIFCFYTFSIQAKDIHVSTSGDNRADGTIKNPVHTIQRAVEMLRSSKELSKNHRSYIWVHGGTYRIAKPIEISTEDSGLEDAELVVKAVEGDEVIITSAMLLNLKWKKHKGQVYKAQLKLDSDIDQLIINDQLNHMARYPNFMESMVGKKKGKKHTVPFNGGAADAWSVSKSKEWKDPTGAYMHAMHRALWGDIHFEVTGKNSKGELEYIGGWQNNRVNTIKAVHKSHRMIENIFEELDAPGEWFYDKKEATLYCYPDENTNLSKAKIEAVMETKELVRIVGDFEHTKTKMDIRGGNGIVFHAEMPRIKKPVHHIVFDGIKFTGTARTFMDNNEPLVRSDWTIYRSGAFYISGAEDVMVKNCTFYQLGGNALFVDGYNRRVTVKSSYFHHNGATDVNFVGSTQAVRNPLFQYGETKVPFDKIDTAIGPKTPDYPADCLVEDCLMTECGRVEKQTAGVNIAISSRITVRHNTIYRVPRAAINICDGCWGGHIIEWNKCFETVLETGDHGAFNSWGRDRFWHSASPNGAKEKMADGSIRIEKMVEKWEDVALWDAYQTNIMRHNFWMCDNGWDVDLDDGSTNYEIYNNLCLRGGLKTREGYHRNVYNNIIFNYFTCNVPYPAPTYDQFRTNIIIGDTYVSKFPTKWGGVIDNTLFHNPNYKESVPATAISDWTHQDKHSIVANAQFIAPLEGNFHVKHNSPAVKLGFKNFPMEGFGVTSERLKKLVPEVDIVMPSKYFNNTRNSDKNVSIKGAEFNSLDTESEQTAYGSKSIAGAIVVKMTGHSAIKRIGLQLDDVVLKVNKKKIVTAKDLQRLMSKLEAGSENTAVILRGQEERTIKFKL
ncbi:PDZ domain-containing protein [Halosquirtibacter xylanolyticus]|uniref:PDZ domain-containing protein n=1 Tax=Halosquirtibacter xylanolyticus TaxID=3374599 RepID=UPI0037494933|nr:PDZ domain-containing protein [Prolixibacteraceae bacterium]